MATRYFCTGCATRKPATAFHRRTPTERDPRPVVYRCRDCRRAAYLASRPQPAGECHACRRSPAKANGWCLGCLQDRGLRPCSGCGLVKPLEHFWANHWRCVACQTGDPAAETRYVEKQRRLRTHQPPLTKEHERSERAFARRTRRAGLDPVKYEELYRAQGERCAGCSTVAAPRTLQIHQGSDGIPRGLVCRRCRAVIRLVEDQASILAQTAAYLSTQELVHNNQDLNQDDGPEDPPVPLTHSP